MKDFLFAIGGLALIFAGIWLFIKLIFYPILFELDLRNQGKKGMAFDTGTDFFTGDDNRDNSACQPVIG